MGIATGVIEEGQEAVGSAVYDLAKGEETTGVIEDGQEAVGSAVYDLAKGEEAHMGTRAADLKPVVVSSAASQRSTFPVERPESSFTSTSLHLSCGRCRLGRAVPHLQDHVPRHQGPRFGAGQDH